MRQVVFCDVDGTLLNSKHKLTPLTEKAIKELGKKGIPFVIVSGRSPSAIYPMQEEYGLRGPIISYSGAVILDENRNVLFSRGMDKPSAQELIDFIEHSPFDVAWSIFASDEWVVKDKGDPRIIQEEAIVKAEAVQGSLSTIAAGEINKILCIGEPQEILGLEESVKAEFPTYYIVKSIDRLLEIMQAGVNKAAAVHILCELWGVDPKDAVAFGDNYNDLEMLQAVGRGVLMGNAPNDLKEIITTHTLDNDSDGVYHALRDMNLI